MKQIYSIFLLLCISTFIIQKGNAQNASCPPQSIRVNAYRLLSRWADTLLEYQIESPNTSLDGGLLCPACARIHGRCGDAVLPLMYMADKSGDSNYLNAAKRLMKWMDNVRMPDGSWMNDVHVSDWNGTTVFASIALLEALRHHGHLLDDSTRNAWKAQLLSAGEFICNNNFIYSRRREGMRNMNVNYSASATYALYAIGKDFNRKDFTDKARMIASDLIPYFTENDHFLFGEGPEIWKKTSNGCMPVDLLYNVEESLPNMAYYALEANDTTLLKHIETSMNTHLEFMLPDGAWDNSWGTRSFKWTYWGGRTSDGFMGGYYALADRNPAFAEAIRRNVALLNNATHDGLLFGGMNYKDWGVEACIHHTFGHAKALASFLNQEVKQLPPATLPRDKEYGSKYFADINTWLISTDGWRATVTGFDAEYKVKGTHPMGGVLSMLWHKDRGPVFAATMNKYTLIEAPNMQTYTSEKYQMSGTPRIEFIENSIMYSNLDDLNTEVTYTQKKERSTFTVTTHLVDSKQQPSSLGTESIRIIYNFTADGIRISSKLPESMKNKGVRFVLPLISSPQEAEKIGTNKVEINNLYVQTNMPIQIAPSEKNRIFNPVPGFTFIPILCYADGEGKIEAEIKMVKP